jgi:hypothetical protein
MVNVVAEAATEAAIIQEIQRRIRNNVKINSFASCVVGAMDKMPAELAKGKDHE